MFEKLGGRKLVFMLLATIVGVVVDIKAPNGLSTNLKDLLIYVGAIYALGNVGSKVAEAVRSKSSDKVDAMLNKVEQQIMQLNANQEIVNQNITTNNQATGEILKRVSGRTDM